MLNYLISISKNEELSDWTIHDVDSKLKVKAFDTLLSAPNPCKGELTYFVTTKTKTLAFETRDTKTIKNYSFCK